MHPTMIEIFNRAVDTGSKLSSELLAEMIHPSEDMTEVRLAAADHIDALADLTAELQLMRN